MTAIGTPASGPSKPAACSAAASASSAIVTRNALSRGIERLDPLQAELDELARVYLLRAHELGQRDRAGEDQIVRQRLWSCP